MDQAPLPLPVQTTLSLFDVQRVEVLKGPQGTLFGNNATGGAINYIANKPTTEFAAGTELSYGRYNTAQLDGFISGPLSNSVLGRFALTTTASADGWQHSQTREDTNGRQDKFAARTILAISRYVAQGNRGLQRGAPRGPSYMPTQGRDHERATCPPRGESDGAGNDEKLCARQNRLADTW
jgi:outer membrane receptor protein involved in Fe transport